LNLKETGKQNQVSEWLDTYGSHNTKRNYRGALKQFFESVYGTSSLDMLDSQAGKYFSEDRDYQKDILQFVKTISKNAPLTLRSKITGVRVFFTDQGYEFKKKFWKQVGRQVKGKRPVTLDKVPSKKELRQILSHMRARGKALFLTLASSGMRIGETLELKLDDVELTDNLVKIHVRGEYTKSGDPRYCFASREAREALEEWLKTRAESLKRAVGRSHIHSKKDEDDRLFPFSMDTAYFVWSHALDKANLNGKDKATGRRKIHPHVLRKFFRTKMASLIQVDIVEALMGHTGYLTEVYRRYTEADLEKFYLQAESSVLIFTEAEHVTQLRKEVEEGKQQLQNLVNGLTAENLELKSRMSRMEVENTDLTGRIQLTEQKLAQLEKMIRETLQ